MCSLIPTDLPLLSELLASLSEPCIFMRPSGLLITGSSGTGKTFLSQYLAQQLAPRCRSFTISCADFMSAEVGCTEKILKDTFFQTASAIPSLLILDGLDMLVRRGEEDEGDMQEYVCMCVYVYDYECVYVYLCVL
ncbi:ATP-binding protein [archaeon]|nr:MAG: ATP-binding protein [archaeon]